MQSLQERAASTAAGQPNTKPGHVKLVEGQRCVMMPGWLQVQNSHLTQASFMLVMLAVASLPEYVAVDPL
jgi:hypothetical protein